MAGPVIIEGPDGQEFEFPEGTTDDVISITIRRAYSGAAAAPASPPIPPQQANAYREIKKLPAGARLIEGPGGVQILVAGGFATDDPKEIKKLLKPLEAAEKSRADAAALRKRTLETNARDKELIAQGLVRAPGASSSDEVAAAQLEAKALRQEAAFAGLMRRDVEQVLGAEFANKNPVVAGALQFLKGVPVVRGFVDEAMGAVSQTPAMTDMGISATDIVRGTMEETERTAPIASAAAQFAGGVAGLVGTPGLLPAITARGPTTTAQIASGIMRGGTAGAVEGAAAGAGLAEEGGRVEGAIQGGITGAGLGAIFGPLSPAGERTYANLREFAARATDKQLASELGTSTEVAGFLRQALQNEDFGQAQAALARAGDKAMLADATQKLGAYLDVAIVAGGAAGPQARNAVTERVRVSSREFQNYMDQSLGIPTGRGSVTAEIRKDSAPQREAVYDAAYAKPIDYSSEAGRKIERMVTSRVPASAIRQAQNQMRVDGVQSQQVLADIAQDGTVTFRRMPDVRELDYIRRALNDVAQGSEGTGAMGGKTQYGTSLQKLSIELRDAMADTVPEYRTALKTAASTIDEVNAANLGYDALSPTTKPEEVRTMLASMTPPERRAAKLGLRNAIEDRLADVSRSASNPDRDSAEFRKLLSSVSSRAFENKLQVIMGDKAAKQFMARLDEEVVSLELMAAIATNSKTAARQELTGAVRATTAPGIVDTLQMFEPLRANKMLVQAMTGKTEAARQARDAGIFDEIASVLVSRRGQDAQMALKIIEKAQKGQAVSQKAAEFAARTILRPSAIAGYQASSQALRYNPETGEVE